MTSPDSEGLTELQKVERKAMTKDPDPWAVLQVVSSIRGMREACKQLLDSRHQDGYADHFAWTHFEQALEDIEACKNS